MADDTRDEKRIKKNYTGKDGIRNDVDDILTNPDTSDASMNDPHENLPDDE